MPRKIEDASPSVGRLHPWNTSPDSRMGPQGGLTSWARHSHPFASFYSRDGGSTSRRSCPSSPQIRNPFSSPPPFAPAPPASQALFPASQDVLFCPHDCQRINNYVLHLCIGRGHLAKVCSATPKGANSPTYAIKIINKRHSEFRPSNVIKEIWILQSTSSPYIAKIYDYWQDDGQVYIVTEQGTGGDLARFLANLNFYNESLTLTENKVKIIFKKILQSVAALHNRGFSHLDLKPGNILLRSPWEPSSPNETIDPLLIDFEFSRYCRLHNSSAKVGGTPIYWPPEILLYESSHELDLKKIDMWSLGIVLFELLHNKFPLPVSNDAQLFFYFFQLVSRAFGSEMNIGSCSKNEMRVLRQKVTENKKEINNLLQNDIKIKSECSLPCHELIRRLLCYDPALRPDVNEVLNSSWFTRLNSTMSL
jgi:serine/threonine protein kinase